MYALLPHLLKTLGWEIRTQLNKWKSPYRNMEKMELRVLGFPNSGKTQFLNALRGIENTPFKKQTIAVEDIPNFTFYMGNRYISIHAKDINGSREFLVKETKNFSNEANNLLFLFDIVSYLTNKDNCKIEIERVLRAINEFVPISPTHGKVAIIMTYADQLESISLTSEDAIANFKKLIADRPYCYYPCYSVNTNDQLEVRNLFRKIANEK